MRGFLIWVVLVGCGSVHATVPGDGGGSGENSPPPLSSTPGIALTIRNPHATIPLGGKNRIAVAVARTGGFTGAITVAAPAPPVGVTVTPITLAADATVGEVIVAGAAPLQIGDTLAVTLEATADGVTASDATLPAAPVIGRPGALDQAFGAGATGVAKVSFGADDGGVFQAMDVINGKIIATGAGTGGLGATSMTTIRLDADGTVDSTWNGGTVLHTGFGHSGSNDDAEAVATARQSDGRSLIIGFNHDAGSTAPCPCTEDIAVARFSLTGGSGGLEFGTGNGLATVDLGGTEDVRAGTVLGNDAIIAAGSKDGQFMVAQLTPDGQLDTAGFAAGGFDLVIHGTSSTANAAVVDSQGRLVVAGTFTTGGQSALNLIRYQANGTHDTGFGTAAGELIVPSTASERAVALRAVGDQLLLASATATSLRVRRYSSDGVLDPSFGTAGVAEIAGAAPLGMVALADGRIVLLTADSQLIRLTADGALDTLFGTAGRQAVVFGGFGVPGGIAVYDDNQIVVSGGCNGETPGPGTFGVVERIWM